MISNLKYILVKKIYGDHNDARPVKEKIKELVSCLPVDGTGLNIGAGRTSIDKRIRNMEIEPGDGIDIVGSVESIPCNNDSIDLIITQEVLEHVKFPLTAMQEIHRVLKPGGVAYIQLPFMIGYHPCPHDFWRFTHEGMIELVTSSRLEFVELKMSVGPAVGFYRIAVEFFSILLSTIYSGLYRPAKLAFAIALYPIKWLDPLLKTSAEASRIPGGYFVVCRKR